MSRDEWVLHYRQLRLHRRTTYTSKGTYAALQDAFKEVYTVDLHGADEAKYRLIGKYSNKVSPRLLEVRAALRAKGEAAGKELFCQLVYSENPLLKLIPKNTGDWSGTYAPIPVFSAPTAQLSRWKQHRFNRKRR